MNTQAAVEYMRTHPFFWSRWALASTRPCWMIRAICFYSARTRRIWRSIAASPKQARAIVELAGCHLYAPLNCAVYADNRVVGVFPYCDTDGGCLTLPEPIPACDAVNDVPYGLTDTVPLPLRARRAYVFFPLTARNLHIG